MRPIDADALKKIIDDRVSQYGAVYPTDMLNMWGLFKHIIDNAPTVLHNNYSMGYQDGVKKVLSERPQGEWIENYDKTDGFTWLTCTRCMCKAYEEGYNFCPKCGAEMRVKGGRG